VDQERIDLKWFPIAGSDEDAIFDGPPFGVAIPALGVLAIEEEDIAFFLLFGRQVV